MTGATAEPGSDLHLFLDESGGADAANDTFLVAAVAVAPHDAARLVRRYQKAMKTTGEVRGSKLAPRGRRVFLDLAAREPHVLAAAAVCRRSDPIGGWAMGTLMEHDLYARLLVEAVSGVPGIGAARRVTVTADGGRYGKGVLAGVRDGVAATLAEILRVEVSLAFGDSAQSPGLQVADVVANTVFGSGQPASAEAPGPFLAPLVGAGRLAIMPVRLEGVRPAWIARS